MVSTPLAYFLPILAERSGLTLIVSSAAVDEPVAEWPHYVAGKHAVEGLARVAAVEYPATKVVVVRPPRLLTDLTNTPLGRDAALGADAAAAIFVRALVEDESIPRGFGVLDLFGQKAK
jgi:NAD(P)-dependent dehydrogenase (short-subunit alcohol dehydrogenase family)